MSLTAEMNLSRLEAIMSLRAVVSNNSGVPVSAGNAVEITENNVINVLIDNDTVKINDDNELYAEVPESIITQEEVNRLNSELPPCTAEELGYALRVLGTKLASWQAVGEPYGTITDSEIDQLFE